MLFNKKAGSEDRVNVASAYWLWRSKVDRNNTIEQFYFYKNLAHDADFKKYLDRILEEFTDEAKKLGSLMNKYSIAVSNPSPADQNFVSNTEIVNDQLIAETLYRFMRLDVNLLMMGMKETPTNEIAFDYLRKLAINSMRRIDKYILFMKAKKWLFLPPEYRDVSEEASDGPISTNSVYLLWDHLIFRQMNARLTQILSVYVIDPAFNALLTAGIKVLQLQIKDLQQKLLHYGIVIPKGYPEETVKPNDKAMYGDKFIFNHILRGMQDAVALHGTAVQEIITNDKLRKYFIELVEDELQFIDRMVKFGKERSWTYLIPVY